MSAFLGPIHFWLYNKIGRQEALTKKVAGYAEKKGWVQDTGKYTKDLPPLEEVIDVGNIHGWLQEQITDAETRYANLVKAAVAENPEHLGHLLDIAYEFGQANAVVRDAAATDIYKAFEDFFVNGMPYDRVNVVISENDDEIAWEMTQDIHARYWDGQTEAYYRMRSKVMEGMLSETPYEIIASDNMRYQIKRR